MLHAQGVLETANSIFKRFRNAFMSQSVNEDLSHSQQFVKPLLATLQVSTSPSCHTIASGHTDAAYMVAARGCRHPQISTTMCVLDKVYTGYLSNDGVHTDSWYDRSRS